MQQQERYIWLCMLPPPQGHTATQGGGTKPYLHSALPGVLPGTVSPKENSIAVLVCLVFFPLINTNVATLTDSEVLSILA